LFALAPKKDLGEVAVEGKDLEAIGEISQKAFNLKSGDTFTDGKVVHKLFQKGDVYKVKFTDGTQDLFERNDDVQIKNFASRKELMKTFESQSKDLDSITKSLELIAGKI